MKNGRDCPVGPWCGFWAFENDRIAPVEVLEFSPKSRWHGLPIHTWLVVVDRHADRERKEHSKEQFLKQLHTAP